MISERKTAGGKSVDLSRHSRDRVKVEDRPATGEKRRISRLALDLVAWAEDAGRTFPWRSKTAGNYEKIAVEVLLQRTTATAVAALYDKFFDNYPDWESLAGASDLDLQAILKPLGLWRRRAGSMKGLAEYAAANSGIFPKDQAAHTEIPAVGQYVSNSILLFQEGKPLPLLDVNMARVLERFIRPRRLADIRYDPWLQSAARWLVRHEQPVTVNWAVLDFAAKVCKVRSPLCKECPVSRRCAFFKSSSPSKDFGTCVMASSART